MEDKKTTEEQRTTEELIEEARQQDEGKNKGDKHKFKNVALEVVEDVVSMLSRR